MVAEPRVLRRQNSDIRGERHEAIVIARGQPDIGDAPIEGVGRIDREMHRAVEPVIAPSRAKLPPAGQLLSRLDLKGNYSHRAPPSVRSDNAAPGPETSQSDRRARRGPRLNGFSRTLRAGARKTPGCSVSLEGTRSCRARQARCRCSRTCRARAPPWLLLAARSSPRDRATSPG